MSKARQRIDSKRHKNKIFYDQGGEYAEHVHYAYMSRNSCHNYFVLGFTHNGGKFKK